MSRRWLVEKRAQSAGARDGALDPASIDEATIEEHAGFLPVEIVVEGREPCRDVAADAPEGRIELELAGGHRLRITGIYDPEALARLIRGLFT